MIKGKITVVHASNVELDLNQEMSIWAPHDMIYIVPDNTSFIRMARSVYEAEKQMNDWIRKYDNLMQGLLYWKDRALSDDK